MTDDRDILKDGDGSQRRPDDAFDIEALTHEAVDAPDLSGQIMHQLGYRRETEQQRRRQLFMRWAGRIGATCAVAIAVKFGIQEFEKSPQARQPVGPTMTEALQNDLKSPIRFELPKFRIGPNRVQPVSTPRLTPVPAPGSAPHSTPLEPVPNEAIGPFKWV